MSYHINRIVPDTAPRKAIEKLIPEVRERTLMSDFESSFLCGLLREAKPRKIVEVGVYCGGSTAIIMQALYHLGLEYEMYSIDIHEKSAGDAVKTGYLGEKAKELLGITNHRFFLGNILPDCINEIGDGIDFLILDTAHFLPGEVLDFLTAFPHLSENAVVCLHDVSLNQSDGTYNHFFKKEVATNALLNSVAAEKYINAMDDKGSYPNIAAFRLNADTGRYITNVAGTLTQTWSYVPDEADLRAYSKQIEDSYGEEVRWIYRNAVRMNLKTIAVEKYYKKKGRSEEKIENLSGRLLLAEWKQTTKLLARKARSKLLPRK